MLRGDHGDDEEEEVGEVEFLPLEITFRNRKSRRLDEERHVDLEDGEDEVVDEDGDGGGLTIYASYNGGAPAPLLSGSGSRGPRHRGESVVCSIPFHLSFSLSLVVQQVPVAYDEHSRNCVSRKQMLSRLLDVDESHCCLPTEARSSVYMYRV